MELYLIFKFYTNFYNFRTPTHPLRVQLAGDLTHIVGGLDGVVGQIEQKEIQRLNGILEVLVLIVGFLYQSGPAESQMNMKRLVMNAVYLGRTGIELSCGSHGFAALTTVLFILASPAAGC